MKKQLLAIPLFFLATVSSSYAQSNDTRRQSEKDSQQNTNADSQKNNDDRKKKLNEYDEIIIKRKEPNKDTKVTIEIKDDVVIVDGKPLDEFTDDEVSVQQRSPNQFRLNPSSQFRMNGGDWQMFTGEDRAFLGVSTEETAGGVKIVNVSENSAAAKAGLKKGDVITKINDKTIEDHHQLTRIITGMKPDDKVTVTYNRDGKESKTTATLGKLAIPLAPMAPDAPVPPMPPMNFNFDDGDFGNMLQSHIFGRPKIGIKAQDTEEGKGVKVLGVDENSPAEKAGIKENDIITNFEGTDVNSVEELAKASRDAKEKTSMKVQLQRNGKPQTIEIKVPKKLRTADL